MTKIIEAGTRLTFLIVTDSVPPREKHILFEAQNLNDFEFLQKLRYSLQRVGVKENFGLTRWMEVVHFLVSITDVKLFKELLLEWEKPNDD